MHGPMSFLKKLRKAFRYSLTIPIDVITNKNQIMDFTHHEGKIYEIVKRYPFLQNKKIILIYSNGYNIKFKNFPSKKYKALSNFQFVDLNLGEEHFYQIDGHLTKYGHEVVAKKLSKVLKN